MAGFFKQILGRRTEEPSPATTVEKTVAPAPAKPDQPTPEQRAQWDREANAYMALAEAMMRGETFRISLGKAEEYQDGLKQIYEEQSLSLLREQDNPLAMYAATAEGVVVGELPRKGKLIDAVKRGMVPVHINVVKIREPAWDNEVEQYSATVDVACVTAVDAARFGNVHPEGVPASVSPPDERGNDYKVGLVGEQYHAEAVADLALGDAVTLCFEPDNPYDEDAIVAVDGGGSVIGYVPRDSWLRQALHEEGKGCSAKVLSVHEGARGFREVVLEIALDGSVLANHSYQG